ncbi:hypothetical protein HRO26_07150 [Treponema pectinovorum]|uniref:hypothetical protein n=1 Tax=Treponema pectinovorum TaxID=164 RepID=UPI003D8BB4A8
MEYNEFFEMIKKVETAYKGFQVFKEGTKKDKILTVLGLGISIVLSIFLFWTQIYNENLLLQIISPIVFIVYVYVFLILYYRRAKTNYSLFGKNEKNEEIKLKDFSKRLNEQNVSKKNIPYIIDYYLNKIGAQQNNKQTEFYAYVTIVFIPVLIGYLNNFEGLRLYVFILAIVGLICVPSVMVFINIFFKKEFMYNEIIYYLRLLNQIENSKTNNLSESSESNVEEEKITFNERNLHSLLASFVTYNEHFKCYAKSIHNERSGSIVKIQNKWVHPDIVGVYFPFTNPINKNGDYEKSTINLIKGMSESAIKLYSFKIKLEVNSENLRECYFQAVSNSSWANEGYLVALKYEGGDKMFDEMKRLTNAFGIGFIELNSKNVEQSRVLVAAQTKSSIDWNTVNRLVKENSDFKDFINFVNDRN